MQINIVNDELNGGRHITKSPHLRNLKSRKHNCKPLRAELYKKDF